MSPVHVIVGDDARAEQMWESAFTGAVDLYRFERNVDAFERLTAAQAPIDLVILTPAQRGPFNLTPDQFVARVLEGPLGTGALLSNLHVIVVGGELTRTHPRAMSVSTLDAAIRLVKFGEIERVPRPDAPKLPDAGAVEPIRHSASDVRELIGDLPFSGSVISRIWNAPDPAAGLDEQRVADVDEPSAGDDMDFNVLGGGAGSTAATHASASAPAYAPISAQPAGPASLFARITPPGFAPTTPAPVVGGGAHLHSAVPNGRDVGAPGEAIEVATGMLQPSRGYHLEGGGAYRGPAVRGGVVHGAGHDVGGHPVPPALASQVEAMVYSGMQVGNPHDPLMVWSSATRGQVAPAQQQVAPMPLQPIAAPVVVVPPRPIAAPMQQQVRNVPMEPPAGVYAPASGPSQQTHPGQSTDPFIRRAEAGGGDVSFG